MKTSSAGRTAAHRVRIGVVAIAVALAAWGTGIEPAWAAHVAAPVLVEDIHPTQGSDPARFTDVDGTLFFAAADADNGRELWKSDGTAAGTVLVADIRDGLDGSDPGQEGHIIDFDGTLFFIANDGLSGQELWKSDGTTLGTELVADINPGASGSNLRELTVMEGFLFFQADDGSGSELWKSDGTTLGTVQVADINPGGASNPGGLTVFGGALLFRADDGVNGSELWKSDGTEAGTVLVLDIHPTGTSFPEHLAVVGGTLFFAAGNADGRELWKSDGTAAGTEQVAQINFAGDSFPKQLTDVGSTLFFEAYDGTGKGLWKSDGTEAGTELVKTIGSGGSDLLELTVVGGTLYFSADDSVVGRELWKSDGTAPGTVLVKDIQPGANGSGPEKLTDFGGTLLFEADDGGGEELWESDGTGAGTVLVAAINPAGGSGPRDLTVLGGTLFFSADDGPNGRELWKTAFLTTRKLTTAKSGGGAGTVTSAPAGISCGATCEFDFVTGTAVELTAAAAAGSAFAGWSGSGCSGTGTCAVNMSEPRTVTATFDLLPDPGPAPVPAPTPSPSPDAVECPPVFADVAAAGVHAGSVDCAARSGIAHGYPDGTFRAGEAVRRDQMASFVVRTLEAAGHTLPAPEHSFADLAGSVHADAVGALAAEGIVDGIRADAYDPAGLVRRDQMAAFLVRAADWAGVDTTVSGGGSFADAVGNTHEAAIDAAFELGLTVGTSATTYDPAGVVARGQMATFLVRLLDRL